MTATLKWILTWVCASIFVGAAFGFSNGEPRFDAFVIAFGMGGGAFIIGIYIWVDRRFPATEADATDPD